MQEIYKNIHKYATIHKKYTRNILKLYKNIQEIYQNIHKIYKNTQNIQRNIQEIYKKYTKKIYKNMQKIHNTCIAAAKLGHTLAEEMMWGIQPTKLFFFLPGQTVYTYLCIFVHFGIYFCILYFYYILCIS